MKELEFAKAVIDLLLTFVPVDLLKAHLDSKVVVAANVAADLAEAEKFGK